MTQLGSPRLLLGYIEVAAQVLILFPELIELVLQFFITLGVDFELSIEMRL